MTEIEHLYIHIPFCSSKCSYCAFYSIPNPGDELVDRYFARLENEMRENSGMAGRLDSIYIGGGTPGWLPARRLGKLFEMISANFAVSEDAEITIECNPESLDAEKTAIIAEFANRISLGAQSFSADLRKTLGRRCPDGVMDRAFDLLGGSGIGNFGCDLIFSIPGQSLEDWIWDLETALSKGVRHISAYSLTYGEGAALARDPEATFDEDLESEMWLAAGDVLGKAGLARYEISNYSIPGFECRHNMRIWFGGRYLGLGPAASSFDGRRRWTQPSDIESWIQIKDPVEDLISAEARAAEILVMGLRTSQGWKEEEFRRATGYGFEMWNEPLRELEALGMMRIQGGKISCTEKGLLLWNEAAEMLIR